MYVTNKGRIGVIHLGKRGHSAPFIQQLNRVACKQRKVKHKLAWFPLFHIIKIIIKTEVIPKKMTNLSSIKTSNQRNFKNVQPN